MPRTARLDAADVLHQIIQKQPAKISGCAYGRYVSYRSCKASRNESLGYRICRRKGCTYCQGGRLLIDVIVIEFPNSVPLDFGHTVHILVGIGLHQTACVLARFVRYIMAIRLEMFCVGVHKRHKTPPNAGKRQRVGGCIRFPPSFSRMFSLALA